LIRDTVERSKDRFIREFNKLEAANHYQSFYTDKGVEERKQKAKLKIMQAGQVDVVESYANMLKLHNSKVA